MPPKIRAVLACGIFTALVACGTAGDKAPSIEVRGRLTVFAAASLTEAFTDVKETLESKYKDLTVVLNFGGSGALVTQIEQGAPADIIATADEEPMKKLFAAQLVQGPIVFAGNKLEILVGAGNRKSIKGLADLARPGLVFVTTDDTVPAGKYTAQILKAAGITVSPKSKELDVKSAVAKVVTGEADATVAYVSDVRAVGSKAHGVPIPDEYNVVARYPIAIVKASKNPRAAAVFFAAVISGAGRPILLKHGFVEPS